MLKNFFRNNNSKWKCIPKNLFSVFTKKTENFSMKVTSCKIPLCCNKNWENYNTLTKWRLLVYVRDLLRNQIDVLWYLLSTCNLLYIFIDYIFFIKKEALFTWCVYFHSAFSWSYNTVHVMHLYCCYHTVSMQTCLWIICFDKGVWKDRTFSKWGNI